MKPNITTWAAAALTVAIAAAHTAGCSNRKRPTPPAKPKPAAVTWWCVDPDTLVVIDDDICEDGIDADGDGRVDGDVYFPEPWLTIKPRPGSSLPPKVRLGTPDNHVIPLPVRPASPAAGPATTRPKPTRR